MRNKNLIISTSFKSPKNLNQQYIINIDKSQTNKYKKTIDFIKVFYKIIFLLTLENIMSLKKITILLLTSLSFNVYANDFSCGNPLNINNLNQAIDFAICNNPQTKTSYYNLKTQENIYLQSKSHLYPTINYSLNYTESSTDSSNNINKQRNDNLNISYLLYDFGFSKNLEVSQELLKEASFLKYENTIQKIIFDTTTQYLNFQNQSKTLEIQEKILQFHEDAYKIAEAKYNVGKTIKLDVRQAETQLYSQKLAVQNTRNNLEKQRNKLMLVLGLNPLENKNLNFKFNPINIGFNEKELGLLFEKALKNNKNYNSLIKEYESLLKQKKSIEAKHYPQISIGYSISTYNKNTPQVNIPSALSNAGYSNLVDNNYTTNTAMITLNIPIFDGWKTTNQVKEFENKIEQKKFSLEQEKNNLFEELSNTFLDLESQKEIIKTQNIILEKAQEAYELAFGRYKVGVGNYTDINNTQQELKKAEIELLNAYNNFDLLKIKIIYNIGNINNKIDNGN